MTTIQEYTQQKQMPKDLQKEVVTFLHRSLQEYGDPQNEINKAIDYSLNVTNTTAGGFVLVATIEDKIVGAVVVNETGMKDYIPENILVYIATDEAYRGKGIGKALMQKAMDVSQGNIALHVEPNNPAIKLYEKLGFTNKYLEMRYIK
ncbi:GNAT family N-acetyltransferase [Flavobacterium sp. '19STA2R22 D10 B1']|uniref:GNAT family N-acetyltransferase n=1 Tax=Flavobacterium aerium TaxID=3037261 RepID=UPI00278C5A0F|nr:GNAT family N-acetyltransferase [Flavobacterium sp. '19STA2R22 D10 B1']